MVDYWSLYSKKVIDHFKHPRNVGEMKNPSGIGRVGSPVCGDIMELQIKVEKKRIKGKIEEVITDAKFRTFGCLPPSEEVVSADGEWKKISSISKGVSVLNAQGKKTKVIETYFRDYQGPMLKITPFVSPYNAFSLTPEHPVLAIKRSHLKFTRRTNPECEWLQINEKELLSTKPEYIRAKELEEGDYLIFVPDHRIKDVSFFTKEVMRLIGYYLSEGYMAARGNVVAFAFNKKEVGSVRELKSLLYKITGKEAKERRRKNVVEVYLCSKKLADFLHSVAGRLARKKKLSKDILLLPYEKQKEMVHTYLIGDGNSYRRRLRNSLTYRITTTSQTLAIQIQEILSRGGIFSSLREIYKSGHMIEGRKMKKSKMYLISYKLKPQHKFVHTNGKYFLVPIRKTERKYFKGTVYNFQVSFEPNSYLVRGFALHNCGAAIATSSMITEMVKGKRLDEALKISNKAVAETLDGLPAIKMHCSALAEDALKAAIDDYLRRESLRIKKNANKRKLS